MEKPKTKNPLLNYPITQLLGYLVTLLLFTTDRLLKYYAVANNSSDGFFVLEKNTGIAFSIPVPQLILPILTIIIILFIISYSLKYLKTKKIFLHFSTLLITTGAISNLIDRLKFGYVIDYFNLKFWPVFNVADVMIVVGVIAWILILTKRKKPD